MPMFSHLKGGRFYQRRENVKEWDTLTGIWIKCQPLPQASRTEVKGLAHKTCKNMLIYSQYYHSYLHFSQLLADSLCQIALDFL